MSSELKTNKISPATGTALQISDSGDTTTIPSGATLDVNGTLDVTGATVSGLTTGKVLQVVTNVVTDVVVSRTSSTWGEITSDTRVTITPISSSSNLILMHTITYNQTGSLHYIDHFKFYDITNGQDVCVGSNASRANKVTTALRGPNRDINDASVLPMIGVTASANTTARTYGVYHRCEQSATRSFYASNGTSGTYPWTVPSVFVVMEVE